MQKAWHFYPKEHFTVEINGTRCGLGTHLGFQIPGVWNLYCLVSDKLDALIDYGGDPGNFPVTTELIPICIGAAYQLLPGRGLVTVGELAATLSPKEFLARVEHFAGLLPRVMLGEASWAEVTTRRAKQMSARDSANVLFVDFKGKRRLH